MKIFPKEKVQTERLELSYNETKFCSLNVQYPKSQIN
jgi:hypothetical protein